MKTRWFVILVALAPVMCLAQHDKAIGAGHQQGR